VKELPFGKKAPQQKQPWVNHGTAMQNEAADQKPEISNNEHNIQ